MGQALALIAAIALGWVIYFVYISDYTNCLGLDRYGALNHAVRWVINVCLFRNPPTEPM